MKSRTDPVIFIHAGNIFLRPWRIEDAEWYVNSRDKVVFQWTTEKRDLTVEQTEQAILQANSNPEAFCYAIADSRSKAVLGNIALVFSENNRSEAENMYWLAPWRRGRGLATQAVKILCEMVFDSLSLERITLKTHPGNVRSHGVAERAGFCRRESTDQVSFEETYLWFELTPEKER